VDQHRESARRGLRHVEIGEQHVAGAVVHSEGDPLGRRVGKAGARANDHVAQGLEITAEPREARAEGARFRAPVVRPRSDPAIHVPFANAACPRAC
jgi:hypothetical protein